MSANYSLPLDTRDQDQNSPPTWQRNFGRRSTSSDMSSTYRDRLLHSAEKFQRTTMTSYRRASDTYRSLSILQRIMLTLAGCFGVAAMVLFLRFGESVFAWIAPLAERWRSVNGGWLVLWALTFFVGLPPLIGYSSCVAVAGFVYGVWKGWLIVASATVLGSTFSFLVSRHLLSSFVARLVAHDRRFNALALTLKHDGLKLLVMIRLCPLPYSLSNGALATFPTVNWQSFMLATALATPKLFVHVFIGSRLAKIADDMDNMDTGSKMVNWFGIIISMSVGVFTAWFIYRQTKRRAEELETQERGIHHPEDHGEESDFDEDFEEPHQNGHAANGNAAYADESEDVSLPKRNAGAEGYRDESSGDERK